MPRSPYALASVEEFKGYLPAQGSTEDPALEKALNRATALLESRAYRHFVTRGEVTEYHTLPPGRRVLDLSQSPVIAITSVHESSLPAVYDATTLLTAEEDYQVDAEHGLIYRLSGGFPISWASGRRAIRVVWSYGYQNVKGEPSEAKPLPEEWVQRCLYLATVLYKESDRGWHGMISVSDGNGSVTRVGSQLPPDMDAAVKAERPGNHYNRTWDLA